VKQGVDTGRRQRYASALADLWTGVGVTLARLEALAAAPGGDVDEDTADELPALQYSLHRASELALGIAPPAGSEAAHAELRSALAEARDATGDMADALAAGDVEAVSALVHEWRGALLRVRLARHMLVTRPAPAPPPADAARAFPWAALTGALLVSLGALAFTSGAVLSLWPLWAIGLTLVAAGFVAYRP
jgi:hypothetical protein